MSKILLVDDDEELSQYLIDWFSERPFVVEYVANGQDALQMLENFKFELVLLDWGLPDMTGLDVLKRFRASGGTTPVIFLTGENDIWNKEQGLDSGADDYLVKPFDVRELAARIRTILRRPAALLPTDSKIGDLTLDSAKRTISDGTTTVKLLGKELAILEFLARNPGRTISAKMLLESIWPSDTEASEDTIRTNLKTLRKKLAQVGKPDLVKTEWGSGYSINL